MKTLTILTVNFRKDLENTLNLRCYPVGGLYVAIGSACTDTLATLLERIVILSHPVYGHSPKLIDMAANLRQQEIHKTNVTELMDFLKENDRLHLEGYVAFRMAEYRSKLDMMMYCLIKKLKLTDSLLL